MQRKNRGKMSTRTLALCALLAALNVVLARLVGLMPDASTRFSIEAVPVFLAGMLFGPMAGAMVGFVSDFVGCLFTPFGFNPIFSVPPVLYGLFGGIFSRYLQKGVTVPRLILSFLPPVVCGSVFYQSATLALMYFKGPFLKGFAFYLSTRSVQFSVVLVLDVLILFLLFRTKLFERLGVWPGKTEQSKKKEI